MSKYKKPRIDWPLIIIFVILLVACVAVFNHVMDKKFGVPTPRTKAIK